MSFPNCPRCKTHFFQATEIEPMGSNFKLIAIHCNSCGAVVGITEYYSVGGLVKTLAEKLGVSI